MRYWCLKRVNKGLQCTGGLQKIQRRWKQSSSESYQSALRPFYLAVHPDFFGQHPEQKAVNENSLKALHSYLDDLRIQKTPTPVKLKFFLKRKKTKEASFQDRDDLHLVTIQLKSSDLSASIDQVLHHCNLPLQQNVSKDKSEFSSFKDESNRGGLKWTGDRQNDARGSFGFTVDMDFSFEAENSAARQKKQGDLPNWFLNNIPTARVRMRSAEPLITENKETVERMKETLGLKGFIVQHPVYSQRTLNVALKQLESLFLNKWSISSVLLQRKTMTLGNFNGVDHLGRLVFDITDVPSIWTEALTRMNDIDDLSEVLRVPELRISELMNGIKISRNPSSLEVIPIETYYKWVTKLLDNLKESKRKGEVMSGAYTGLKGQVTKPRMFPIVSPEGDILIPCVTSMVIVDRFLQENFKTALEARRRYARSVKDELEISAYCRMQLGLQSLLKDRLISPSQMIIGCKRLLECHRSILEGTRVIVSNYYGVTSDGDIRVPWEFQSGKNFDR